MYIFFFSYFKINNGSQKINFSVPTGNFGDVFAGYIAKKMGLPINKLIVATNKNDILNVLTKQDMDEAYQIISGWNNYSPTPLISLNKLSKELNIKKIFYKKFLLTVCNALVDYFIFSPGVFFFLYYIFFLKKFKYHFIYSG